MSTKDLVLGLLHIILCSPPFFSFIFLFSQVSFLSFWSLLIRMHHLICYHNIWSRHIYLAMPTEYYVAGIRKTVLCFFFPFSLWRVKSPSNTLKRSHKAKVCYFLYNLFWLFLSFPLHIFFFYLHDDPFVVGFDILNAKMALWFQ